MTSSTILKEFDGHTLHAHGIISAVPIEIVGKAISIKVKVIDAPIDYNFILGNHWLYEIKSIVSLEFHVLYFPHQ